MAFKINTSFISLEIIKIEKVSSNCYIITIDRTELETIRTTLSTALDKFKNL